MWPIGELVESFLASLNGAQDWYAFRYDMRCSIADALGRKRPDYRGR